MRLAEKIVNHLQQEIIWIDALNVLLTQERELLIASQFHALDSVANEKMALSNQLEQSAKARMHLMDPSMGQEEPKKTFSAFLKLCSESEAEQINLHNNILAEKLTLCRDLNTINGQVIATNMHNREVLLSTLTDNNAHALNIYTATGNVKNPSGNGHYKEV